MSTGQYDSMMHIIADKLMDQFEGSDAVNYIEQSFENKDDPSKCFVLTMQMKNGLTPCEKLEVAGKRIVELEKRIESQSKLLDVAGKRIAYLESLLPDEA